MERLEAMMEALIDCVECQIHGHLKDVDTKELGEAIDMIKDLSEAMYYYTITEAMEGEEDKWNYHDGALYEKHKEKKDHSQHHEMMRDPYEGKSGLHRKKYMEDKIHHKDKTQQMQDLEEYMQELANDMTEMIADTTMEEKQLLQQKIAMLASKIK